jgi:hypothetical protein
MTLDGETTKTKVTVFEKIYNIVVSIIFIRIHLYGPKYSFKK